MDLVRILKYVPVNTELYCTVFGEVKFNGISVDGENKHICISDYKGVQHMMFSDGRYFLDGECVLFPSKTQRDWGKFEKQMNNIEFKAPGKVYWARMSDDEDRDDFLINKLAETTGCSPCRIDYEEAKGGDYIVYNDNDTIFSTLATSDLGLAIQLFGIEVTIKES